MTAATAQTALPASRIAISWDLGPCYRGGGNYRLSPDWSRVHVISRRDDAKVASLGQRGGARNAQKPCHTGSIDITEVNVDAITGAVVNIEHEKGERGK